MAPDYYIYAADVYCERCTADIKRRLKAEGNRPANFKDETTFDSSEWPKGPYSDEESDSPDHCASGGDCLDPTIIGKSTFGKFLENPLTTDGERYVRELHLNTPGEITQFWMDHYNLSNDEECDHPNAVLSDSDSPATYHCPDCGENFIGDEDEEPGYCETCGEEMDIDCSGSERCEICDGPCPQCCDGPGYAG